MRQVTFLALVICVLCFESCEKSIPQRSVATGDMNYESLVQEKDSPLLFMDVTAKIKKADEEDGKKGQVIYGTINNTAMHTKFKDVTLSIKYYSRENDLIDISEVVVRDLYQANTRTKFEVNVHAPDSMQTFEIEVKDAKGAN